MMKKTRFFCFFLAALLLMALPMGAFAEAPAGTLTIKTGKATKNESGAYQFSALELSGGPILGVQVSFADQMRPGDGLVVPGALPEGITANEMLTSHAMLSFDIDPAVADTGVVQAFLRSLSFTKGEQTKELQVYFDLSGDQIFRQVFYNSANDKYYEIFYSPCCALPVRYMDRETFVKTDDPYPVVRGYSQRIVRLAQYVMYRRMHRKPARIVDEDTDKFVWEVLEFGATIGAVDTDEGWYWMVEKGQASGDKVEYARIAETEARYGIYLHYSINLQKQDDGRHGIRSAAENHQCTGYLIEYDKSFLAQGGEGAGSYSTAIGKIGGGNLLWLGWVIVGLLAVAGLAWAVAYRQKQKKKGAEDAQ